MAYGYRGDQNPLPPHAGAGAASSADAVAGVGEWFCSPMCPWMLLIPEPLLVLVMLVASGAAAMATSSAAGARKHAPCCGHRADD
eukprot:4988943-Pleurochrysis_carterae.AAC.1